MSSSVRAATRTWTGTNSGLWTVAANWGGTAPVAGDDLVFPSGSVSNKSNTNDFVTDTNFNSITFTGTGYTLNGNRIKLDTQIVTSVSLAGTNVVNLPISLAGSRTVTFTGSANAVIHLDGVISGTGPLNILGSATASNEADLDASNTYTSGTSLTDINLRVGNDNAFGTGTVTEANTNVTVGPNGHTLVNALSLQGCGIGNNTAINSDGTLTGPVSLTANTCIGSNSNLTFTGAFSGNFQLMAPHNSITDIVRLNGNSPAFTGTLRPTTGILRVNGSFASATATFAGGTGNATLGGTGTVGALTVQSTNHLAPGNSPGILNTGNLDIQSGSSYDVEINGATPGSGYDQTNVTGTVTLAGTLNVTMGFVPSPGDKFTIINNDGADAVIGTFAGLAQNATFVSGGNTLSISYTAGDGNDVALTVISSVPVLPPGVMWTLAAALAGVGVFALRRRQRLFR